MLMSATLSTKVQVVSVAAHVACFNLPEAEGGREVREALAERTLPVDEGLLPAPLPLAGRLFPADPAPPPPPLVLVRPSILLPASVLAPDVAAGTMSGSLSEGFVVSFVEDIASDSFPLVKDCDWRLTKLERPEQTP